MKKLTIEQLFAELKPIVTQYPVPLIQKVYHDTNSAFLSLVACILSARTKDTTTEKRLPAIYEAIPNPATLREISQQDLEKILYPIGFYKTKAKNLKKLGQVILELFNDQVPDSIEEMIKLPGAGRKTANLIVSVVFDKPGICVDTHVHRMMNYIGYVKTETPLETEKALRKKLPVHLWRDANHYFVILGQTLCTPFTITKDTCPLNWFELIDSEKAK